MEATVFELKEIILATEQVVDIQFQFWLTTSFATIVAAYAGRNRLTTGLRHIVVVLYLLATLTFISRWYYAGLDLAEYRLMLEELGRELNAPWGTLFSRLALMICGSLVTVFFVYRSEASEADVKLTPIGRSD